MKKNLLLSLIFLISLSIYSQDNYFKFNDKADVLFRNLSRGSGGRAFVHDGNNTLTINYARDFTGGVIISSDLKVEGTLKPAKIYLEPTTLESGWYTTNFEYRGHTLRIGSPSGMSTHNNVEIVPGTNPNALRYTSLGLFTSSTLTALEQVVLLSTNGPSFFNGGNVGIGTKNPTVELEVAGTIKAKEVRVEITAGSDHVFHKEYNLKPLSEVEAFVTKNKHLPEIPSEKQMQEEGLSINEFQIKLLQKIEELTLYVIEQQKTIEKQGAIIEVLQQKDKL